MNIAKDTVRGHLSRTHQLLLLHGAREVVSKAPLVRPLSKGGRPMSVRVSSAGRLGWSGDGEAYRYTRAQASGEPWPPIPEHWVKFADRYLGRKGVPWDSAILNFYGRDAKLGWHQDRAEHDLDQPIVTFSLGDSASWAVRMTERSEVHRTTLDSGAVTILDGETRGAFHAIERVVASPLTSPMRAPGRLSITLRVAGQIGED